jgi:NTE family protein
MKYRLLVGLLLLPFFLWAQNRPKVAVVLSGGGAKGTAHIGALKVIEKAGIPVDYVVGTSMGALVGGIVFYWIHSGTVG